MTVIRKRPEVSTEAFRHFMEHDYGPTYVELPQTRRYVQHYLADATADGAEAPIDAIVEIAFDSAESMAEALLDESYQRAHAARETYMLDTSVGIHSAVVQRSVDFT